MDESGQDQVEEISRNVSDIIARYTSLGSSDVHRLIPVQPSILERIQSNNRVTYQPLTRQMVEESIASLWTQRQVRDVPIYPNPLHDENAEVPIPSIVEQRIDYRKVRAINNSIMGTFEYDFKSFKWYWVEGNEFNESDSEALLLGSLIDCLLTDRIAYEYKYQICMIPRPTGQMGDFCDEIVRIVSNRSVDHVGTGIFDPYYLEAYNKVGFKRDKLETVKEKFLSEEYLSYYQEQLNSRNKIRITQEQFAKAESTVLSLKNSEFTRAIINQKSIQNTKQDIEVFYQLEIYSTYRDKLPIKGMLDKVIIDNNKKIIIPIDIKSSSNINRFEESVVKYNYFRQAAFYIYLLEQWKQQEGNDKYKDYIITDFIFAVCSTNGQGSYIYRLSQKDIEKATNGGVIKGVRVKGFIEILNDVLWHTTENKWEYRKEVYENNGKIKLNIFDE